jgi:triacylglycerol lipase
LYGLRAGVGWAKQVGVSATNHADTEATPVNIILAHGFLGFRKRFGIEYFFHIAEFFQQLHANVLVPEVDPTAGISIRGEQLRAQILKAFEQRVLDPNEKAHIVAHSMGGLDSRYALSPANSKTTTQNDIAPRIASLTTVSTPHRGSPVADLVALKVAGRFPSFGPAHVAAELAGLTEEEVENQLNSLGISEAGLLDLTTESTQRFNQTFKDNPAVRYFSVAGEGRRGLLHTSALLLPFYLYIEAVAREKNDGLVTVPSAKWGTFDEQLWPTDHADEVGHNLDNILAFDAAGTVARYTRIVNTFSVPAA